MCTGPPLGRTRLFTALLALFGIGALAFPLVNRLVPGLLIGVAGLLSAGGTIQSHVAYTFSAINQGSVFAGICLLILAAIVRLALSQRIGFFTCPAGRFLVILLVVRVVLSLAAVYHFPYVPAADDLEYYNLAQQITRGETLHQSDGQPTAYRSVGYPFTLSRLFPIFGANPRAGQIWNVILLAGILVLTYFTARTLMGEKTARLASLLLTLTPSQYLYAIPLLSDLQFTLLLLGLLYLMGRRSSLAGNLLMGICYGAAVMTRGVILLFPLMMIVYWRMKDWSWKPILTNLAVMGMVAELMFFPWQIRNYRLFGEPITTNTTSGYQFWMGNNPRATGFYLTSDQFIPPADQTLLKELNEVQADRYCYIQGVQYIFRHPLKTVARWPRKILFLLGRDSKAMPWAFQGVWETLNPASLMAMIIITEAFYTVLFIVFLASLVFRIKQEGFSPRLYLLTSPVIYVVVIHTLSVSEGRYHLPLVPVFAILAASAFHEKETL